ncbi:MAG TPA: sulfatase-like hydrolase/transferase [Mycobacteriales bacterium]|nr:sulfatase-like hydrolase/transferase [Mycobacteriales bacterium]
MTPDVLLIITDEHRHDALGCTGDGTVRTPALDRLAAHGTVFENAFCTYPACAPSRYSIMTGQYAHEHGGFGDPATIRSDVRTFPEQLREHGYRTAAVGQMHLAPNQLDIGFERMILAEQSEPGRFIDDYHRALRSAGLLDRVDLLDQTAEYRERAPRSYWEDFGVGTSDLPEEFHSTTWIGDRAVEQIAGWDTGPNLLAVSFIKPHHPFDPPAPWDRMYDPEQLEPLPGWIPECLPRDLDRDAGYFPHRDLSAAALRRVMAAYYGSISQVDAQIARILEALRRTGRYDGTLVIFTSDHGEYLGYHHLLLKGGHLYDPLVRIPLIVKFPHGSSGRDARLVSHLDLAPTILGRAGLPVGGRPGFDLAHRTSRRDFVLAENLGPQRQFLVRSERFTLLEGEQPLFFDRRADPFELDDRSGDLPAEVERHRAFLRSVLDPAAPFTGHGTTDRPQIAGPVGAEQPMRDWAQQRMAEWLSRP